MRGESSPQDLVFLEWAPPVPKRNMELEKPSKLGTTAEIDRALNQSTRAVISPDGWKLCLRDQDKNELYNLRADPEERKNLYSDAAHQGMVKKLTDGIYDWQQRTGDSIKI